MAKFATGKFALGTSDRSGFVYKLNDMKLEWTGALVGPDEWEKKQPQLEQGFTIDQMVEITKRQKEIELDYIKNRRVFEKDQEEQQ